MRPVAACASSTQRARRATRNPTLRGELLGALHCARDAVVEPRQVLPALRARLERAGGYYVPPRACRASRRWAACETTPARAHDGDRRRAVSRRRCTTASAPSSSPTLPVRRCRLQMLQTEPFPERLTTALADGDSLRYYPAFAAPARPRRSRPRLRCVRGVPGAAARRAAGVRGAHDRRHPPLRRAVRLRRSTKSRTSTCSPGPSRSSVGALPPVRRRWAGVYSQATDDSICVRVDPSSGSSSSPASAAGG